MEDKFLLLKRPVIVCSDLLKYCCSATREANFGMERCPYLHVSGCFYLCYLCASYARTTMKGREVFKIGSDSNCSATHACNLRRAGIHQILQDLKGHTPRVDSLDTRLSSTPPSN